LQFIFNSKFQLQIQETKLLISLQLLQLPKQPAYSFTTIKSNNKFFGRFNN